MKIVVAPNYACYRSWCGSRGESEAHNIFVPGRDHSAAEMKLRGIEIEKDELVFVGRVSAHVRNVIQSHMMKS